MMSQNKRKPDFNPNSVFAPPNKKCHFGGSPVTSDHSFDELTTKPIAANCPPFQPRYWSSPRPPSQPPPMGPFYCNRTPMVSPRNYPKTNHNSRPIYETREWDPVMGPVYRPAIGPTNAPTSDSYEILVQLRRTTDVLKSEMSALRETVELSTRRLMQVIKESDSELRECLVQLIDDCNSVRKTSSDSAKEPQTTLKNEWILTYFKKNFLEFYRYIQWFIRLKRFQ